MIENLKLRRMAEGCILAAYAEAESLHRRSLEIFEKVLGPDHPKTSVSLNNLAMSIEERGQFAEAEQYFRRSLTIS